MKKKFSNALGYGLKISLLLLVFALLWFWLRRSSNGNGSNLTSIGRQIKPEFPVCVDSANVWLNDEQSIGRQTVRENCLSGIVYLPLETKFISDAPGRVEYWFITPSGYKVISVADREAKFPRTKMPSCTFRMRGKRGIAKIQIELRN